MASTILNNKGLDWPPISIELVHQVETHNAAELCSQRYGIHSHDEGCLLLHFLTYALILTAWVDDVGLKSLVADCPLKILDDGASSLPCLPPLVGE